ncbi:unnamed protein product, partial [Bubo scandiacus]
ELDHFSSVTSSGGRERLCWWDTQECRGYTAGLPCSPCCPGEHSLTHKMGVHQWVRTLDLAWNLG